MKLMAGLTGALALTICGSTWADGDPEHGFYGIKIEVQDFQKSIDFYSKLTRTDPPH